MIGRPEPRDPRTPVRGGMAALLACALGGLSVGLFVGGYCGYSSEPLIAVAPADCEPAAGTTGTAARSDAFRFSDERLAALLADSEASNLELALRIGSLERLLEELRTHDLPPSRLVAGLVEDMEVEEIHALMGEFVSLSPVHLQEIQDIRAFVSRMAEVALAGTFEPDRDHEGRAVGAVLFATERAPNDPESVASSLFPAGEAVIHAMIPVDGLRGEQTVLKWIRLEPPQIVAFRRLSLVTGDAYYSYGLRRSAALRPGHYRVEVYRVDDELTPIAMGSYAIE